MQIKNEFVCNEEISLILSEPCNQSQSQNHRKMANQTVRASECEAIENMWHPLEAKKLKVDLMKPQICLQIYGKLTMELNDTTEKPLAKSKIWHILQGR